MTQCVSSSTWNKFWHLFYEAWTFPTQVPLQHGSSSIAIRCGSGINMHWWKLQRRAHASTKWWVKITIIHHAHYLQCWGKVDNRDGHTVLTCQGSAKGRCAAIEKNGRSKKVARGFKRTRGSMQWLRREIGVDFVQHKKGKHVDAWPVLSLDNLPAHCSKNVKKMLMGMFC